MPFNISFDKILQYETAQPKRNYIHSRKSRSTFGGDIILEVNEGEQYSFEVGACETWTDLFLPTDADGFFNPLLLFLGKRVPKVKCFTLCGTIGKDEQHHFRIGSSLRHFLIPASGSLYFFPNDNNKGEITVQVTREK